MVEDYLTSKISKLIIAAIKDGPLTINDICKNTNLKYFTVHRYITMMKADGMLKITGTLNSIKPGVARRSYLYQAKSRIVAR